MRAKIAAFVLSVAAVAVVLGAQDQSSPTNNPPAAAEHGRGWVQPTEHDHHLLRTLGSHIRQIHLNLHGLTRIVRHHRDNLPGKPPPSGKLVRTPGKGLVAHRSITSPLEPEVDEATAFPHAIDNSQLPCFPPIFSQGELNSCTSVATTYYQLTHMTGLARGWDQRRGGHAVRFSPQWTFNLINNGNNLGAFQSRAYAALLAHGAAPLDAMPYHGTALPAANYRHWPADPALWQQALEYRPEGFGVIQDANVVAFLRRVKLLLVNGHVLTAATAIDGWNQQVIVDNPQSHDDTPCVGEFIATAVARNEGNHCITIVGYNDDIWVDLNANGEVDAGEKGALKIANSWGTGDWNHGFRWLHYAALYAPRTPEEAAERQAALFANQAFWITPAREYAPAVVMQVDLPAMYRNEFRLAAGVRAPAAGSRPLAAPNFAFDYNGGHYGFDGHGNPETIRAVLDLTHPAQQVTENNPEVFVHLARTGQPAPTTAPHARLVDIATGTAHELALTPTAEPGTFVAATPKLVATHPAELRVSTPAQLDLRSREAVTVPIEITRDNPSSVPPSLRVFSCNAGVLATDDLAIERDAQGRAFLRITPPAHSRGTCVLTVFASEGGRNASSTLQVNLLGPADTPPKLSVGVVQRDNLRLTVPFKITTSVGKPDDAVVFFDTTNLDQIGSYSIEGSGAERTLVVQLRFWAPFQLHLSALDKEFVGASHVKVES